MSATQDPTTRTSSTEALPYSPRTRRRTADPRHARRLPRAVPVLLVLCMFALVPRIGEAESNVILEEPRELEDIGATTFDDEGRAVGRSSFEISTEADGVQHMTVRMEIEGGGRNVSEAILAPIAGALAGTSDEIESLRPVGTKRSFRILEQRSQATRADGVSLELLVIDHREGRVSCYPPDGDRTKGAHLDLPEDDRVVNVPMQLLFVPLVSGEVARIDMMRSCSDINEDCCSQAGIASH